VLIRGFQNFLMTWALLGITEVYKGVSQVLTYTLMICIVMV